MFSCCIVRCTQFCLSTKEKQQNQFYSPCLSNEKIKVKVKGETIDYSRLSTWIDNVYIYIYVMICLIIRCQLKNQTFKQKNKIKIKPKQQQNFSLLKELLNAKQ